MVLNMNTLRSASPIPHQPWTEEIKAPLLNPMPTVESVLIDEPVPKDNSSELVPNVEDKLYSKSELEIQDLPVSPKSLLEDLTLVDRIYVTRKLRLKRVLMLRGKKNKFFITTSEPRTIYFVEELNRWWVGYLFYNLRPLQLKVTNSSGTEVMRIIRPYACTTRIMPCQTQRLIVRSPDDTRIGTIEQVWTAVKPLLVVNNAVGDTVFRIQGPLVTLSLFNDINFKITRMDGQCVGGSYKKWQGLIHACFLAPLTDQFSLAFEKNLTVEEKALLLAASILIDYMYYSV